MKSDKQSTAAGDRSRPLWAPWRIRYIREPKEPDCFLCRKAASDSPEDHVIGRGKEAFVLLNDFPYNSGHLLVAPVRHVGDLADLTPSERNEVMELLVRAENVLRKVLTPGGFNIGFNLGEAAGAGLLDHVHAHIVPRWVGDTNFMPVVGDVRVVPEALEATARLLRDAWE